MNANAYFMHGSSNKIKRLKKLKRIARARRSLFGGTPGTRIPPNIDCDERVRRLMQKRAGKVREEDLLRLLEKFEFQSGLEEISKYSFSIFLGKSGDDAIGRGAVRHSKSHAAVTQFSLAYTANILILAACSFVRPRAVLNRPNLVGLSALYGESLLQPELLPDFKRFSHASYASFMVRMHVEQFEYQIVPKHVISRTGLLFGAIMADEDDKFGVEMQSIFFIKLDLQFRSTFGWLSAFGHKGPTARSSP